MGCARWADRMLAAEISRFTHSATGNRDTQRAQPVTRPQRFTKIQRS
jgi:hypothetical protein